MMKSLAHRVILAGGWPRRLIALLSGAVGGLAMAPIDFVPALIVPMTVAVWLLDGAAEGGGRVSLASLRSAAIAGWWWGFGYFLAGLWWLGSAFLVEPDYAWALPLGIVALPALLAVFTAFGFACARLLWSPGAGRILALAAGLGLSEWLRGHLFGGFPWNAFGMALGDGPALGQIASLVGLYGLTIIAVALAAAPATLADAAMGRRLPRPVAIAVVVFVAIAGFGAARLATGTPGVVNGVKLRIMQPNLVQDAQFRAENKDAILTRYLALSDRATSPSTAGIADATHLIWPETALPTVLARDPEALARIGAALPASVTLIAGAYRTGDPAPGDPTPRFFNSIQVIASGGQVLDSYDKVHLVPFGEYLPFASLVKLIGLAPFVRIPGDFEAGARRKSLNVPGLPPVSPLICYEAIFPAAVGIASDAGSPARRPGLLLNVSNDSWFGLTAGPYQHLAQARLRTIEEGLPLVRAATTGISAVVDPFGRVIARLPVGVEDVLDSPLPRSLPETFFVRHGTAAVIALWGICLLGALAFRRPA
ncbi:MAG: apolipoprotein N-acyltransferase [Methylobacteriaceae bacterium]|nr:apolipoprotein N-acyltransferase [Methylobacteriaceae bacterium]